jgi:hypothetical protein
VSMYHYLPSGMKMYTKLMMMFGVVSGSGSIPSTPREDHHHNSCPTDQTPQMNAFYLNFISSPTYIDSVRSEIITDDCFFILSKKFERKIEDETVFENALNGLCSIPTRDPEPIESAEDVVGVALPYMVPRFTVDDGHSVRLDDCIASEEVAKQLKHILKSLEEPADRPNASVLLYYLHVDLSQRSVCPNIDSRVFRKLVEQVHYRFTVGASDGGFNLESMIPVLTSLYTEAMDLEIAARGLAHPAEPKFMIAPLVLAVVPIVAEIGCWCIGRCIKYYRDRTSTTTTTTPTTTSTPSTIAAWVLEGQRRQIEQFINVANADLDEIMIKIGSVSDTDFEKQISALRTALMVKVMATTKGMVANGGSSYDPGSTIESSLRLTELLSRSHTSSDWPAVRKEILTTVSSLRSELFAIRTPITF